MAQSEKPSKKPLNQPLKKKSAPESCESCGIESESPLHPDHSASLHRLKKIQGQLNGIERMIQERRYCFDILTQFRAVSAALQAMEAAVLEKHLANCVQEAFASKNAKSADAKIQELLSFLKRH